MPRPKKRPAAPPNVVIFARVSPAVATALDAAAADYAKEHHLLVSRSDVVRRAVDEYLERRGIEART